MTPGPVSPDLSPEGVAAAAEDLCGGEHKRFGFSSPSPDRIPCASCTMVAEASISAYLAVTGEGGAEQVRKDLTAIAFAAKSFAKTGEADRWEDVQAIAERAIASLPSPPTGQEQSVETGAKKRNHDNFEAER